LPVDPAAVPSAPGESLVRHDEAEGKQPVTEMRRDHPLALRILSRLSLLEMTLGLPPVKPRLLRPAADQPVLARQVTTVLDGDLPAQLGRHGTLTHRPAFLKISRSTAADRASL
jgi:hypothetical protein